MYNYAQSASCIPEVYPNLNDQLYLNQTGGETIFSVILLFVNTVTLMRHRTLADLPEGQESESLFCK